MYVCCCNGVTDRQIIQALDENETLTLSELNNKFGIGKRCGKCIKEVRNIFDESLTRQKKYSSKFLTGQSALA